MVCLGRTTLLPRLFPNLSFRFLDAGLGPLLGSIACGFSVFIEEKRKRAEMALYVAPRALFAVAEMAKPGWASGGARGALWAERWVSYFLLTLSLSLPFSLSLVFSRALGLNPALRFAPLTPPLPPPPPADFSSV